MLNEMILFRAQMTKTGEMEISKSKPKGKSKGSLFFPNKYAYLMLMGLFVSFFGSLAIVTSI